MTTVEGLELRHFGHDDVPRIRQTLFDVYNEVYAAEMLVDEFYRKFAWFVDHWGGRPDFSCVIAYDGDEPTGFIYGAPALEGREWWRRHLETAPEKGRTFHVSELMVRERWRKTGTSARLHRALMGPRPEDVSVLLVDSTHPKVQALYESWGYHEIGRERPFADAPLCAVMLAELPLT